MANQYKHSQDKSRNEASPQSLYELLIYDNHKLASKLEGPHVILRRSVKGSAIENLEPLPSVHVEPEPAAIESLSDESPSDVESARESSSEENTQQLEEEPGNGEEEASVGESGDEFVEASTISNYLASLSSHVQSDVLRVVDAIIELEKAMPPESLEKEAGIEESNVIENEDAAGLSESNEEEQAPVKRWADDAIEEEIQVPEKSEITIMPASQPEAAEDNFEEESDKKKGIDISDIFRSLKNARKKAQQKNYSYTKKVEYEDH